MSTCFDGLHSKPELFAVLYFRFIFVIPIVNAGIAGIGKLLRPQKIRKQGFKAIGIDCLLISLSECFK